MQQQGQPGSLAQVVTQSECGVGIHHALLCMQKMLGQCRNVFHIPVKDPISEACSCHISVP